jgi:hypothetical protein
MLFGRTKKWSAQTDAIRETPFIQGVSAEHRLEMTSGQKKSGLWSFLVATLKQFRALLGKFGAFDKKISCH